MGLGEGGAGELQKGLGAAGGGNGVNVWCKA